MTRVIIRLYEPGDEAGIIELFNSVFPAKIDRAHWQWKFADNPAGFPLIIVAAHGPRIIGHIAVNPVQTLVTGQIVRAAQAVDMMVGEEYRGQQLIAQIAHLALEHLQAGYAPMSFGFPVPRFQPFTHEVLGWNEVCTVRQAVKPLNVALVFRRLLKKWPALRTRMQQPGAGLVQRQRPAAVDDAQKPPLTRVTGFDVRFDRLWEDVAADFEIAAIRDQRYLNWRYPHPDYVTYAIAEPNRVSGFAVLRTTVWEGRRVGCIADLLARDGEVAGRLLRAAAAHFRQEGADLVRCWMMDHRPYQEILRRLGFIPRPSPYKLMVRSHAPSAPLPFLLQPAHWHLTLGDSDGV